MFVRVFKFLLLFLIFNFLLFTLSKPALAQTPPPPTNLQIPSYISPTSPLYTDMLMHNMFHTFSCLGTGLSVIGQPCLTYKLQKNAQGVIQSMPVLSSVNLSGGVLGTTTSLIGSLFANPPVRTADYLASVGKGLGVVKEANAQVGGSGQAVLSPILALWQVSRNIAYLIMIIIFIVIGMMVMFRNKVNPQTVITAQAALPGLVIGLILITFSYFLAGLITDTAFVGTNLAGYYFTAAQNAEPRNLVAELSDRNVVNIFTPFTRILNTGNVSGALNLVWDDLADPSLQNVGGFLSFWQLDAQRVLKILTTFVATQFLSPFGNLAPGLGNVVAGGASVVLGELATLDIAAWGLSFIGMLALIYAMFRLLMRLVTNYLTVIFLTITAPFQFLFAALPGRQGMATGWMLNLLGNVLAFPAVLIVLYFVAFILGPTYMDTHCNEPCPFQVSQTNPASDSIVPTAYAATGATIIGNEGFPLLGGFDLGFLRLLLAFGALLALPAIPDIIKRAIGTVSQAGQLIGQEIGAGTGAGQRYSGQITQGTQGAVGQFGRITDESGYTYRNLTPKVANVADQKWGWVKVTQKSAPGLGLGPHEMASTGFRAGTGSKFFGMFRGKH